MIQEDILDFDSLLDSEACATGRRHRALRKASVHRATTYHTTFRRTAGDHRGRRALRETHPAARGLRRLAPRARHLRYSHFTRPPRRRLQAECSSTELLDGLSITGGYDGTQVFFKLALDVSKGDKEDLREVILKPLQQLSKADFLHELNLFGDAESVVDSIFDGIDADISFSSGAHMEATGRQAHLYFSSIHSYHLTSLLFILLCTFSWIRSTRK